MEARTRPCRFSHAFPNHLVAPRQKNRGKGASTTSWFPPCSPMWLHARHYDGQRWSVFASDLPQFLQAIAETPDDIIVGNRFSPELFTQQAPNMSAAARRQPIFQLLGMATNRLFSGGYTDRTSAPIPCITSTDWTFSPIATRRNWNFKWCSRLGAAQDCDRFP